MRAQSQERVGRGKKKEVEEEAKEQSEAVMGEEELNRLMQEVCDRWLLNRQVVLSLHLYRTSASAVEMSVTTVFSLKEEGAD